MKPDFEQIGDGPHTLVWIKSKGNFIWVLDNEKESCLLLELKQAEQGWTIFLEIIGKLNLERTWLAIWKAGCPKCECHCTGQVRSPTKTDDAKAIYLKQKEKGTIHLYSAHVAGLPPLFDPS